MEENIKERQLRAGEREMSTTGGGIREIELRKNRPRRHTQNQLGYRANGALLQKKIEINGVKSL